MEKNKQNNATKDEHRDYARSLYLTVDPNGKQKYSSNEIASILNKDFGTNYHRSTILRWAKKRGWDKEFRMMRQHGVEQSREPDMEVLDKKTKDIANLYEVVKGMNIESHSQLWERLKDKKLSNRELLQLLKHTQDTMLELNDAKDKDPLEEMRKIAYTAEEIQTIEGELYDRDENEFLDGEQSQD
jgi:hypothetical protein